MGLTDNPGRKSLSAQYAAAKKAENESCLARQEARPAGQRWAAGQQFREKIEAERRAKEAAEEAEQVRGCLHAACMCLRCMHKPHVSMHASRMHANHAACMHAMSTSLRLLAVVVHAMLPGDLHVALTVSARMPPRTWPAMCRLTQLHVCHTSTYACTLAHMPLASR